MNFTGKWPTETLRNEVMTKAANAMDNAALEEHKRASITVSMTTYLQAYVLYTDQ